MKILKKPVHFQWDRGNSNKNLIKHSVHDSECEEVFFDQHKRVVRDKLHSDQEDRYILLGQTRADRILFLVFTVRGSFVRVISAREVSRKEQKLYGKKTTKNS